MTSLIVVRTKFAVAKQFDLFLLADYKRSVKKKKKKGDVKVSVSMISSLMPPCPHAIE